MLVSDWSSYVCSSDLEQPGRGDHHRHVVAGLRRELVVDVGVPEATAVAVFVDAQRPALTAVVGGQGHFDAAVELAQPFVEIGGGGHGGGVRVVAGVEA